MCVALAFVEAEFKKQKTLLTTSIAWYIPEEIW